MHLVVMILFTGCGGVDWFPLSFTITPASLPSATVGVDYNQTLTASGSTSTTFTWTIDRGTLPTGLTLGLSTGILSGTPTAPGIFTFTVRVTDSQSMFATQNYTIKTIAPLSIDQSQLNSAEFNVPYSQTLTASGGTAPYTWSVSSGSLPAWMTLNSATGALTGTPDAVGSSTFTIQVIDADGMTSTRSYTLVTTLSVLPAQLPNAIFGTQYSQSLTAAGGVGPYTWTVTAGSLPNRMILSSQGVISSNPVVATPGVYNFTVTVTDSQSPALTASKDYVLTVQ